MRKIIRFIDRIDEHEGVLMDMEYTRDENSIAHIVDLRIHNIINGIVGELVEVSPVIKVAFAANLLSFLEGENEEKEQ